MKLSYKQNFKGKQGLSSVTSQPVDAALLVAVDDLLERRQPAVDLGLVVGGKRVHRLVLHVDVERRLAALVQLQTCTYMSLHFHAYDYISTHMHVHVHCTRLHESR